MDGHAFLMPFVLNSETSTPIVEPVERMFAIAARKGASKHPLDKGGLTMCGITLATFREYCRRKGIANADAAALRHITFEVWEDIFKSMFWDRWQADSINSASVAAALVDWTWVSGANGIRLPQKLLGVEADGVVGPRTLQAVNSWEDTGLLFSMIQECRKDFHRRIAPEGSANRTFLRGWNARVDRLTAFLNRNANLLSTNS